LCPEELGMEKILFSRLVPEKSFNKGISVYVAHEGVDVTTLYQVEYEIQHTDGVYFKIYITS
jgi:hypothetical protein